VCAVQFRRFHIYGLSAVAILGPPILTIVFTIILLIVVVVPSLTVAVFRSVHAHLTVLLALLAAVQVHRSLVVLVVFSFAVIVLILV
jgi:hypothetical protein